MDELRLIWNAAADLGADGEAPEGIPEGVVQLSYLLRVYNSTEGGGLGFAFEVNEAFRVERAITAMRYFGLLEMATFFANLQERLPDYDFIPSHHEDEYRVLVRNGDAIDEAFRAVAAERPAAFNVP